MTSQCLKLHPSCSNEGGGWRKRREERETAEEAWERERMKRPFLGGEERAGEDHAISRHFRSIQL